MSDNKKLQNKLVSGPWAEIAFRLSSSQTQGNIFGV